MKKLILTLLCCVAVIAASAQIGYQVSLLNNATGEPRANERVNVTVKITDSKGNIVCEESKTETTNDFGVLSMSVGNSDTFSNADWSNLPFFIEASVGGRLIGKSQLLSVPVAEHAKHTGSLTKEILCSKTWMISGENYKDTYKFNKDGTWSYEYKVFHDIGEDYVDKKHGTYEISGDDILLVHKNEDGENCLDLLKYYPSLKIIVEIDLETTIGYK